MLQEVAAGRLRNNSGPRGSLLRTLPLEHSPGDIAKRRRTPVELHASVGKELIGKCLAVPDLEIGRTVRCVSKRFELEVPQWQRAQLVGCVTRNQAFVRIGP